MWLVPLSLSLSLSLSLFHSQWTCLLKVYIIHVVTAGGTTWMLFKRFSEFYELDKQVRCCL